MHLLTPTTTEPRADVALFVPQWLPDDCEPRRASHLLLPIVGAVRAAGYRVRLFEQAFDGVPDASWAETIAASDVVVAWCAELYPATQIPGLRAFLDVVGRVPGPRARLAGGGFFPLLAPDRLDILDHVDAVVIGPGEVALPAALDAVVDGGDLADVGGLVVRRGGRSVVTAPARRRGLDPAQLAVLDELELSRYLRPDRQTFNNAAPALQLHTGSGCAKRCPFCFDQNNPYGVYPATGVVDAIRRAHAGTRGGVRQFLFGELDFFHKTSRVRDVVRGIRDLPFAIRWFALGSVQDVLRLTDADLDDLTASGCHRIELGSESGSTRVLRRLGKVHAPDDVARAVQRLERAGIATTHNFLFGSPGETESDRAATLRLIDRVHVLQPTAHVHARLYQVVPSTSLGAEALGADGARAFPATLDELERYRDGLPGPNARALPWLSRDEEEWVKFLTRYLVPLAYQPVGLDGASRRRAVLRRLARWRCRTGIRLGARTEERLLSRSRLLAPATTYVP